MAQAVWHIRVWFALLETLEFKQLFDLPQLSLLETLKYLCRSSFPWLPSLFHYKPDLWPTGRPGPPFPRECTRVCPGPASFCLHLKALMIPAGFFFLSDIRWQVESNPVCWKVFLASEAKIFFVTLQSEQVSASKHRRRVASRCLSFLPPVYSFTTWNKGGMYWKRLLVVAIYLCVHLFIHVFCKIAIHFICA